MQQDESLEAVNSWIITVMDLEINIVFIQVYAPTEDSDVSDE